MPKSVVPAGGKPEPSCPVAASCCRYCTGEGHWSLTNGQWSVVIGQWSMTTGHVKANRMGWYGLKLEGGDKDVTDWNISRIWELFGSFFGYFLTTTEEFCAIKKKIWSFFWSFFWCFWQIWRKSVLFFWSFLNVLVAFGWFFFVLFWPILKIAEKFCVIFWKLANSGYLPKFGSRRHLWVIGWYDYPMQG